MGDLIENLLGFTDAAFAATALVHGYKLATLNTRDFVGQAFSRSILGFAACREFKNALKKTCWYVRIKILSVSI